MPTAKLKSVPRAAPAPNYTTGEKTDKLTVALIELAGGAVASENLVEELAQKLQPKKRSTIVSLLVLALFATGGPLAVVYTTQDNSEANALEIEALKPRMMQVESDVRATKDHMEDIDKSVGTIKTDMRGISGGIDELKEENVNRLKAELEDAKQALRREQRNNR